MPVCYRTNPASSVYQAPRAAVITAVLSPEDACMEIISAAADRGEKCPTNSTIADALGYMSVSGAQKLVQRLCDKGVLRVEMATRAWRVVTICATGKKTRAPKKIGISHRFPKNAGDR